MKFKSGILEMIHENAAANYEIGAISETRMREYDEMCCEKDLKSDYITSKTNNSMQIENLTPVTT